MSATVCGEWSVDFVCNANYLAPTLSVAVTVIYTVLTGLIIWATLRSTRKIIREEQRLRRLELHYELQRGWNSVEMLEARNFAFVVVEEAQKANVKGIRAWLHRNGRGREWTDFAFVGHYIDRVVGELREGQITPMECADKLPAMKWWAGFLKKEYNLIPKEARMRDNLAHYDDTVPMNKYQQESAKWPTSKAT